LLNAGCKITDSTATDHRRIDSTRSRPRRRTVASDHYAAMTHRKSLEMAKMEDVKEQTNEGTLSRWR
jgi:hypothetical protein